MEFNFRGINTAFYIFIKLPDVNNINYALPPLNHLPPTPVCVRNISHLPTKDIGRLIGLGISTKARTSP